MSGEVFTARVPVQELKPGDEIGTRDRVVCKVAGEVKPLDATRVIVPITDPHLGKKVVDDYRLKDSTVTVRLRRAA